jgi:ribosome-associated protein
MIIRVREDHIKLGQALKASNLVETGSDAKEVILNGEVFVNGEQELRRGRKLYPGDIVEYNGESIDIL